ncbi:MAG: hypothetical protein K8F62_00610 [Pseudorhodoplanes sp.]|nr:hypothetical protein [Pseudorhodoplanes sp.]
MRRLLIPCLGAAVLTAIAGTPAFADCTCRAQAVRRVQTNRLALFEVAALRVATCGMVLNNSAWEFSQTSCLTSQRLPQPRPAALNGDHSKDKS